ncbi:methylated-DNA--[protein]-cysteine S-methyltransferase [Sphingomonas sp.]|uniref:methylated-DNA--[protein]-cysteine S-methyltransferase n=1 Tax=Sphingomonas sp. TaxID=28214 RepID=UPI001D2E4EE8|nr:methylated-DNA--[protein]-cysteine S-methyltransferase [Sphingomonas sp.]MBX9795511.1 methylated-DNA--[protein]-cysteine S-methyltransferase [Sphingomonas sp.]
MYAREQGGLATPIAWIGLTAAGERLLGITISGEPGPKATGSFLRGVADQLEAWFAGARHDFDVALTPAATPRGETLRAGLIGVGYGSTMSYGALAHQLGSAPRAIGQLCARNPFPIIVPCHRILGAGGALGQYSAGDGSATKAWLLAHERTHAQVSD